MDQLHSLLPYPAHGSTKHILMRNMPVETSPSRILDKYTRS
ncbi:hypothetical protein V6Z11_D03G137500 [Gossypium hirsutum]